jgi:hypothetical protein
MRDIPGKFEEPPGNPPGVGNLAPVVLVSVPMLMCLLLRSRSGSAARRAERLNPTASVHVVRFAHFGLISLLIPNPGCQFSQCA